MEKRADDSVSEFWHRTGISTLRIGNMKRRVKMNKLEKSWHGAGISTFGIENMKRDVEMNKLPPGKDYHLYVVHSKEDTLQAVNICKQLEIRFRLKCILCLPSQERYKMLRSLTILLLLSPTFLKDVECGFQMRLAFQMSVYQPFNLRIIKVLLQDVDELPPSLEPYSCIDAQKTCDLIAEINDGLQGMRKKVKTIVDICNTLLLLGHFIFDKSCELLNQNCCEKRLTKLLMSLFMVFQLIKRLSF